MGGFRPGTWVRRPLGVVLVGAVVSGCEDASCVPSPTRVCDSQQGPSLTYAQTAYESPFFTAGNTVEPRVSWGDGPVGTLSLSNSVSGVSLDDVTGVVSWDRSLPLGSNTVQVQATNPVDTDVVALTIESYFEADFTGAFNEDPDSQDLPLGMDMRFNRDGSVTVVVDDGTCMGQPCEGNGTWTINASTVTIHYFFPHVGADGSDPFRADGTLTYSDMTAELAGTWFNENAPQQDGRFRLTIN